MINRRSFLKRCSWFPLLPGTTSLTFSALAGTPIRENSRTLVLVELRGGNDGLNTVIPFRDDGYYEIRPSIAIPRQEVLKVSEDLGFHPALSGFAALLNRGNLAVIQGVGTFPSLKCHIKARAAWYGGEFGPSSECRWFLPPSDIKSATKTIMPREKENKHISPRETDPQAFEKTLIKIAQHILKGSSLKIYHLILGGFDTHANQVEQNEPAIGKHARLLQVFSSGITQFLEFLDVANQVDRVLVMAFSEFGRTVYENATLGTDHGASGPVFLAGGKVKGGFYGAYPSLKEEKGSSRTISGDLIATTDFKEVYSNVLSQWFRVPTETLVKRQIVNLGFLETG